ncbi:MAG TPA: glutathione S-transferase family protein [Hyphomonadaceae bacterium]|nr:glutathione S-transferase family protein [Hyphomonadaceae bacterium]
MPDIILHHYAQSPYSQKIRSFLGFKGLDWRSHVVPWVPPRPELNLLTGGNRKIPILQIGADIICDSTMILRTLEKLYPPPPISHAADILNHPIQRLWEPRQMIYLGAIRFRSREDVGGMFASDEERTAFLKDRIPFMAPASDITKSGEFMPSAAAHVRLHAFWLDHVLSSTGPFLGGSTPSPADFSAFHGFWWLRPSSARQDLLSPLDALWAWVDRMEKLDQGATPTPITGAEVLAHARDKQPAIELPNFPLPNDPKLGARVSVTPDDYGKDPVTGDLVSIGPDHVILRRETPETGTLHVHFPRWGYRLVPA